MLRISIGVICFFVLGPILHAQEVFTRTVKLMGSRFDITVVANDEEQGDLYIDQAIGEVERIERLISSWDSASQTASVNRMAGKSPVKVDSELFQLIERSIVISKLTSGAFDITYASMDKIWFFDGTMTQIPDSIEVARSVESVGYENILLNKEDTTVFLAKPRMKIGFGAIGKGYAADKAKKLLQSEGVVGGIINASGDMNTWGEQPDGSLWKVAITNPMNKNVAFGTFPISNRAVVTSGDYEKFIDLDGQRFSHIINPKTGYPATGLISVSVFAPKAELADALATAIFVMGKDAGISLVDQLPDVDCVLISDKGELFYSNQIKIDQNTP